MQTWQHTLLVQISGQKCSSANDMKNRLFSSIPALYIVGKSDVSGLFEWPVGGVV